MCYVKKAENDTRRKEENDQIKKNSERLEKWKLKNT